MLERIKENERKLEALYTRVDGLENLCSRNNISEVGGNGRLDVVSSEEPSEQENSEEQQVIVINIVEIKGQPILTNNFF